MGQLPHLRRGFGHRVAALLRPSRQTIRHRLQRRHRAIARRASNVRRQELRAVWRVSGGAAMPIAASMIATGAGG